MYGDSDIVRRILTEPGDTWAIVGLSSNQRRAAYGVAEVLQRHGKRIVPVHPKAETVHGEQGYASLAEIPFDVDVVDVFVNSDLAGAVADEAVAKGAKAVWFQLDVIDEAAYDRTRAMRPLHGDGQVPGDRAAPAGLTPRRPARTLVRPGDHFPAIPESAGRSRLDRTAARWLPVRLVGMGVISWQGGVGGGRAGSPCGGTPEKTPMSAHPRTEAPVTTHRLPPPRDADIMTG